MKALNRYSLISLILAGSCASTAMAAAANSDVSVTANVVGTCQFSTTSVGSVAFGDLTPGSGVAPVPGVVTQPQFWCTKGTVYTISDDKGKNGGGTSYKMKHATAADTIPYTFSYTTNSTTNPARGPGIWITMNVNASIANAADYDGAAVGSYSDIVTLTVTP